MDKHSSLLQTFVNYVRKKFLVQVSVVFKVAEGVWELLNILKIKSYKHLNLNKIVKQCFWF
jgi:hypothetical protein